MEGKALARWREYASRREGREAAKEDKRNELRAERTIMQIRLNGEVAVVTGGGGVLCGAMSRALAWAGSSVAVLDARSEAAVVVAEGIESKGGKAIPVVCDVLDRRSLEAAAEEVERRLGAVTILVNGAGGNRKEATCRPGCEFFDLPTDAIQWVLNLNFLGTLLPCQVFGRGMAARKRGTIVNVSSMNAFRPLTMIPAYSAAKAAVTNFTKWLAVHMSQEYSTSIRVNAIAPGFFQTDQNRFLLETEAGELTERGRQILEHTPMERFGTEDDLLGTLLWLVSPQASFVHGIVVPVDGGFSAYSGV